MNKFDKFYMDVAIQTSYLSQCAKKKVGAILVKDGNIISFGFNGTCTGWYTNVCEDTNFKTKEEVVHAEENAVCKAAKAGLSTDNSTMYITYAPCKRCSRLLHQSGIKSVIWLEDNDKGGKYMLDNLGIFNKKITTG